MFKSSSNQIKTIDLLGHIWHNNRLGLWEDGVRIPTETHPKVQHIKTSLSASKRINCTNHVACKLCTLFLFFAYLRFSKLFFKVAKQSAPRYGQIETKTSLILRKVSYGIFFLVLYRLKVHLILLHTRKIVPIANLDSMKILLAIYLYRGG